MRYSPVLFLSLPENPRLRAELDVASSKLAHYEEHIHNLLHSLEDNMQRDYRDITTSLDTIRGYTDALVQMSLASSGARSVCVSSEAQ